MRRSAAAATVAILAAGAAAALSPVLASPAGGAVTDDHCRSQYVDFTRVKTTCTWASGSGELTLPASASQISLVGIGGHGGGQSGHFRATKIDAPYGTSLAGKTISFTVGGDGEILDGDAAGGSNGGGNGGPGAGGGGGRTDAYVDGTLTFVAPGSGGAGATGFVTAYTAGNGGTVNYDAGDGGFAPGQYGTAAGGTAGKRGAAGAGGAGGTPGGGAGGERDGGNGADASCTGGAGGGGGAGYGGGGGGGGGTPIDGFRCSGGGGGSAGGVLALGAGVYGSPDTYDPAMFSVTWTQNFAFTNDDPPKGTVGQDYSFQFTTDVPGATFTAEDLPDGLTLSSTGLLSGKPTTAGGGIIYVYATDPDGGAQRLGFYYLQIVAAPVAFTASTPPDAPLGQPYSYAFTASDCTDCVFTADPTSLPAGLGLAADGTLSGQPTGTARSYTFTVTATSSDGRSVDVNVTMDVFTPPTITTTSLPDATVGTAYSQQLNGSGDSDLTWSGAGLPDGFTLTPGGLLSGTPKSAGTAAIKVKATDAGGHETTADLTLSVSKGAPGVATAYDGRAFTVTVSGASGASVPTGSVRFEIDGKNRGTVPLSNGIAKKPYTIPAGLHHFRALYSGDDNWTADTSMGDRNDPMITATPSREPNENGWYRAPVTISFACVTTTADLANGCPAPATLRTNGANQRVSRTITAKDGGTANATLTGINIDQTIPSARLDGVSADKTYTADTLPNVTCVASDSLSGLVDCPVKYSIGNSTITYAALATDRAGNTHKRVTVARFRGPKPPSS